jgi:fucose 4-O-acetylase-like acetyltransferase
MGAEASSTETKRLRILDVYKGLAILGVIVTHLVLLQNGGAGKGGNPSALVQFMFSGLLMFMVISGYFYKPGRTYLENVKRRVIPLFLIAVAGTTVMTLILFVYMVALGYDATYNPFLLILRVIIGKGVGLEIGSDEYADACTILAPYDACVMIYYLIILSLGYLIFYAIADRVLKDWRITIATAFVLLLISSFYVGFVKIQLPFFAQYAPMVAALLLVGALLAKYKVADILENGYRTKVFWIGLVASIVCAALCLIFLPAETDIVQGKIGTYAPFNVVTLAITSVSCGMVQLYIASLFTRIPGISHLFSLMGFNVLYLYLLHMVVAKMIIAPFVTIGTDVYIPLAIMPALALAFGTIAIILVMSYIYRRIKPKMLERIHGRKAQEQ